MKKILFILLFIFISINHVFALEIDLNYTDTSDTYKFSSTYQYNNHNITTDIRNHIYYLTSTFSYGIFTLPVSNNYHNITFYHDNKQYQIIENIEITSKNLIWIFDNPIGRNINYTLSVYDNGILLDTMYYNYDVSSITCQFGYTKYEFTDNILKIQHVFSSLTQKETKEMIINFENDISLSSLNIDNYHGDNFNFVKYYIEYSNIGIKPKSYYINQLIPILRIPYKNIGQYFDKDNDLLNIFLVLSFLLKSLFFWIKVIYQSLFTIIIIILVFIIPLLTYITSYDRKSFIFKLINNYKKLILFIVSIINKIIEYILKVLQIIADLIPFT